ncbi:MAG: c-type cytochrome, partial [Planctomycetota bacterium]|nr:c-type cytochrome [Planctomycetota bacterium]
WANHTPNTPAQAAEWSRKHGWFDNHHWIYPMQPERFVESSCLKCHHRIEELLPSERFPEPPAPTLVHGYDLVTKYGCYGCHEINGYDGQERIGPDLRNEPPYAPAAQQLAYLMDSQRKAGLSEALLARRTSIRDMTEQLSWHPEDAGDRRALYDAVREDANRSLAVNKVLADPGLPDQARELARSIKKSPDNMEARSELVAWLEQDLKAKAPQARAASHNLAALLEQPPLLSPAAHTVADLLKDSDHPGTLRRVGPSLRYVASKLGTASMNQWITNPQDLRPTSKMPRFYGLHDHLKSSPDALATAKEYEPIEIRAVTHYLASRSQPFAYAAPAPAVTEPPDAERGEVLFETRGCLACHQHKGTLQSKANHGPNLTNLADKLRMQTAERSSKAWLRSWLLAPDRYHRRTVMPNAYLTPEPLLGPDGKPLPADDDKGRTRMTDPAADIAEYLLGAQWQGTADALPPLTADQQQTLSELALTLLKTTFPTSKAEEYLKSGIPTDLAATLKGAEVELLGGVSEAKLLSYVGSRTMTRAGCAGCHDIPGFEGEKPIGTTMADWGRKETSKLAFEHILHYVEGQHAAGHSQHGADHDEHHREAKDEHAEHTVHAHPPADADQAAHHLDPVEMQDSTAGFFVASLQHHQREGFLWQKLNEPRSYDYKKAENKPYHDRLRMPLFSWGAEAAYNAGQAEDADTDTIRAAKKKAREQDIQAIMTFVLGLVAEPPAAKYIYHPNPRRKAIVEGEAVLAKFNCAGCHVLELDRWDIAFRPGDIDPPSESKVYPFLQPHFSASEIERSKTPDWRGRLHTELVGMPRTNPDGHPEVLGWLAEDEEFIPLDEYRDEFEGEPDLLGYNVELWKPTLLDGQTLLPKDPLPTISQTMITRHVPARGGDYAQLLLPIALQLARQTEPGATGADAWAWVPPPLIGQGRKTQQAWLTEFLLRPHPIRPGVLLRMPKFNMSRADAAQLVQYFAATSHANYPDQFEARRSAAELQAANVRYQQHLQKLGLPSSTRLDDALQLAVNKAGCVQCHSLGNLQTDQAARAAGPNLGVVYRRLQPDYLKNWIAKPSFTLPYTKMQELIPYDKGFLLTELDKKGKPELDADGKPKTVQVVHGTATQQLQAVVDLLGNFGEYLESRTSIRGLVERQRQASEETASLAEPPLGDTAADLDKPKP